MQTTTVMQLYHRDIWDEWPDGAFPLVVVDTCRSLRAITTISNFGFNDAAGLERFIADTMRHGEWVRVCRFRNGKPDATILVEIQKTLHAQTVFRLSVG